MTETELHGYRARLLALAARLSGEVSGLRGEAIRPAGAEDYYQPESAPTHPDELATHRTEEDTLLGLVDNEEQLLAEVNEALARMDRGTFGRCAGCGRPLSRTRLSAVPYARDCARCAHEREDRART